MIKIHRLLLFVPFTHGGLADYAQAQGQALAAIKGVEVLWLAPNQLETPIGARRVGVIDIEPPTGRIGKLRRVLRFMKNCLGPIRQLDDILQRTPVDAVLFASYAEYFAPLWAWRMRHWRRRGVRFGAVVHDPVRDYQVGPRWWHRWSISEGYSFMDVAFVHEIFRLETGNRDFPTLRTVIIPHGIYEFASERCSKAEARRRLDLPQEAPVFLSFGHIRDGKNLDLFLQAMVHFPEVHLVIAGQEQSGGQKPAKYYQELAAKLGLIPRIRWHARHIEARQIGFFFAAADFLLLTYSSAFRSASGVLSAAACFEIPVLASSGEGPLKTGVQRFDLGVWVEPDSIATIQQGLGRLLALKPDSDWSGFRTANSWAQNASLVGQHLLGDQSTCEGRREVGA